MRRLTAQEVHAHRVAELGLDPNALDLTSIEAIAGALRRAASFLCPCTAGSLVRAVVRPLRGLVEDLEAAKDLVEETLEAMVAHGDILENAAVEEVPSFGGAAFLYAAPASFVVRQNGTIILLGVASDELSALPDELETRIEYVNHVRRLTPLPGEELRQSLIELGLVELSHAAWLRLPPVESPAEHLSRLNRLLDAVQPSHDVPGLLLLNPQKSVRYYRGRWVEPKAQSGRFVARRTQAYGAPLWCFVQLRDGHPELLMDFPVRTSRWRGCDEAWRLQIAIDFQNGEPQRFRIQQGPSGWRVLEFFSPVPMWARRRWDAVGEPVLSSGCLFAYRLPDAELKEELQFVRDALWLSELTTRV